VLKCRDMAELVTGYLENALPPRTRLAARFHLWICGSCRRYVNQIQRTIRFLAEGPPPLPPENEDKIMDALVPRRDDN
jgi:predicted anti-sigma-YlaC factor YlaD